MPSCSLVVFCVIVFLPGLCLELNSGGTGLVPAPPTNRILDGTHKTVMTALYGVRSLPVSLYSTTGLDHW